MIVKIILEEVAFTGVPETFLFYAPHILSEQEVWETVNNTYNDLFKETIIRGETRTEQLVKALMDKGFMPFIRPFLKNTDKGFVHPPSIEIDLGRA